MELADRGCDPFALAAKFADRFPAAFGDIAGQGLVLFAQKGGQGLVVFDQCCVQRPGMAIDRLRQLERAQIQHRAKFVGCPRGVGRRLPQPVDIRLQIGPEFGADIPRFARRHDDVGQMRLHHGLRRLALRDEPIEERVHFVCLAAQLRFHFDRCAAGGTHQLFGLAARGLGKALAGRIECRRQCRTLFARGFGEGGRLCRQFVAKRGYLVGRVGDCPLRRFDLGCKSRGLVLEPPARIGQLDFKVGDMAAQRLADIADPAVEGRRFLRQGRMHDVHLAGDLVGQRGDLPGLGLQRRTRFRQLILGAIARRVQHLDLPAQGVGDAHGLCLSIGQRIGEPAQLALKGLGVALHIAAALQEGEEQPEECEWGRDAGDEAELFARQQNLDIAPADLGVDVEVEADDPDEGEEDTDAEGDAVRSVFEKTH